MRNGTFAAGCIFSVALAGCGGGVSGTDGSQGVQDLSVAGTPDLTAVAVEDLTMGAPAGSPCMSTCDCQAGLTCRRGTCGQPAMGGVMLYCCDSSDCPSGSPCQSATGMFGRCGGGGPNADGGGAPCTTACDCMPGLACRMGQCRMGLRPTYCCDTTPCPTGSACQSATGTFGRCGTDGGFGPFPDGGFGPRPDGGFGPRPDGGATVICGNVPCVSDQGCQMIGCGSCDPTTGLCQ